MNELCECRGRPDCVPAVMDERQRREQVELGKEAMRIEGNPNHGRLMDCVPRAKAVTRTVTHDLKL